MTCQHSELRRGTGGKWFCVEPSCQFVMRGTPPIEGVAPMSLDELITFYGDDNFSVLPHPKVIPYQSTRSYLETGRKAVNSLLAYGYSYDGGEFWKPPLGERPVYVLRDQGAAEREIFESWVRTTHPEHWPNPDADGSRTWPDGIYRNKSLHERWEAWQAALVSANHDDLMSRINFAADALTVVERRRDELRRQVDMLKGLIMESTRVTILRACVPGDLVFLKLERDAPMERVANMRKHLEGVFEATHIKIIMLDHGISVAGHSECTEIGKPVEPCVYVPMEDASQEYGTGCGNRWHLPVGSELYPFCPWCGKPVQERLPTIELESVDAPTFDLPETN